MSIENSRIYKVIESGLRLADDLAHTRLVQHGDLPYARELTDDQLLDDETLLRVWLLGHSMFHSQYCRWRYFAYTQIPEEVLSGWGISSEYTRAIYIPSKNYGLPFSDVLLLNPNVQDIGNERDLHLEGCGSIDSGGVFMVMDRPHLISLTATIWSPWRNGDQNQFPIPYISGWDAGGMEHELAHLNGLTALDEPHRSRILDVRVNNLDDVIAQIQGQVDVTETVQKQWAMVGGLKCLSRDRVTHEITSN